MASKHSTCSRRITFCAGHRVYGHENKCASPHGHNYVAIIFARPSNAKLDEVGRVVDFSVLKAKIGDWIEQNWDHAFIYYSLDTEMRKALWSVTGAKSFAMAENPTAENMARFLLHSIAPQVMQGTGAEVYRVEIQETENCTAYEELPW